MSEPMLYHWAPEELQELAQWVVWRFEERDGKTTKVPYSPRTRYMASSTDRETWSSYPAAVDCWRKYHQRFDGVGFVFAVGGGLVGADLDKCRDPETGEIAPWARRIVERLGTYWEVSPSGTGLKGILRAEMPGTRRKKNGMPGGGAVELYPDGRYFTVTGKQLQGTAATIEECQADLAELYADLFPEPAPEPPRRPLPVANIALSDLDLLRVLEESKHGAEFRALWGGSLAGHDNNHSSADLALCNYLAWVSGDPATVDRLFRQSGLYRDKWDEKRRDRTYGQGTIERAFAGRTDFYTPPWRSAAGGGHSTATKLQNGKAAPVEPAAAASAANSDVQSNDGNAETLSLDLKKASPTGETAATMLPAPSEPEPIRPERITDLGMSQWLVRLFGTEIRYNATNRTWHEWDGTRWAVDSTGKVYEKSKAVVAALWEEITRERNPDRLKVLVKLATARESLTSIRAAVALAQTAPGIPVQAEALDRDPMLYNTLNGTVDLRTGELRPHRQSDLITKRADVVFDPNAECPLFLGFLSRIMDGNADLMRYMQKAIGHSLTGVVKEKSFFIPWGTGDNGKTTLLELVRDLMGEYAMRTPVETLMAKRKAGIPNDIARLRGVRFVYTSETEVGQRLAVSLIKDMTGGDTLSARFLHGEFFDFQPEFKLWLSTNHKPVVTDTNKAIWNRIKLIPFAVSIPKEEQDTALPEKLRAELPGILAWAVRGCLLWQQEGLQPPDEIKAATEGYRREMDSFQDFLDDCCIIAPEAWVKAGDIRTAYDRWCTANGEERPLNRSQLTQALVDHQFEARNGRPRGRHWVGLALRVPVSWDVADSEPPSGFDSCNATQGDMQRDSDPSATGLRACNGTQRDFPGSSYTRAGVAENIENGVAQRCSVAPALQTDLQALADRGYGFTPDLPEDDRDEYTRPWEVGA